MNFLFLSSNVLIWKKASSVVDPQSIEVPAQLLSYKTNLGVMLPENYNLAPGNFVNLIRQSRKQRHREFRSFSCTHAGKRTRHYSHLLGISRKSHGLKEIHASEYSDLTVCVRLPKYHYWNLMKYTNTQVRESRHFIFPTGKYANHCKAAPSGIHSQSVNSIVYSEHWRKQGINFVHAL